MYKEYAESKDSKNPCRIKETKNANVLKSVFVKCKNKKE